MAQKASACSSPHLACTTEGLGQLACMCAGTSAACAQAAPG